MCVFVCVCATFFHHSVVLFYSSILLLWYVGYDDFISMNNVFVFVLIKINFLLVLSLAIMKITILEKSPFSISDEFLYFSLFLHFIYFCISSKYIFLINFCFSVFLSSSVFIFSLTLFFYHYHHGNITITIIITDIIIIIIIVILLTLQSSVTFSFYHQYYHIASSADWVRCFFLLSLLPI